MANPMNAEGSDFFSVSADEGLDKFPGKRSGGTDRGESEVAEAEPGAPFTPPSQGGMRT